MIEASLIHGIDGFRPALAGITERIEAAGTPEDLEDLAEVARTRDVDEAAEMMARGMFLAELLGRLDAVEEDEE